MPGFAVGSRHEKQAARGIDIVAGHRAPPRARHARGIASTGQNSARGMP